MPLAMKPMRASSTIHGPAPRKARLAIPGERRSNASARAMDSSASRLAWPSVLTSAGMQITDVHIHVQPWWEMKPGILEAMTRGRTDLDELHRIMKSPALLLRRMDADGIARAVPGNYPS